MFSAIISYSMCTVHDVAWADRKLRHIFYTRTAPKYNVNWPNVSHQIVLVDVYIVFRIYYHYHYGWLPFKLRFESRAPSNW